MSDNQGTAKAIFIEQVRLLYGNAMVPLFVSVFAGAILSWSQWNNGDNRIIGSWFLLFFIVSLCRIGLLFAFKRGPAKDDDIAFWNKRFLVGTYIAAVIWGSAPSCFFPKTILQTKPFFSLFW